MNKKFEELKEKFIKIQKRHEGVEERVKKRNIKKAIIITSAIFILAVLIVAIFTIHHFFGNNKYITADVKISSSSKLYQNSDPEDIEDVGEGALFIIRVAGIKRDDFLEKYEVMEIDINGEKVNLDDAIYKHLNKAFSIKVHSKNYNLEKGNSILISIKEKQSGNILRKRLYHKTDIV